MQEVGARYPFEPHEQNEECFMLFDYLAFSALEKEYESVGVKQKSLPDGQPPIVTFTMLT